MKSPTMPELDSIQEKLKLLNDWHVQVDLWRTKIDNDLLWIMGIGKIIAGATIVQALVELFKWRL